MMFRIVETAPTPTSPREERGEGWNDRPWLRPWKYGVFGARPGGHGWRRPNSQCRARRHLASVRHMPRKKTSFDDPFIESRLAGSIQKQHACPKA
jgi:hypothetical protein